MMYPKIERCILSSPLSYHYISILQQYITNQQFTPNKVTEIVTSKMFLLHNNCVTFIILCNYWFRWADNLRAKGSDGKERFFDHPFFQSLTMFFGEFLCLLFFKLAYRYHIKRQVSIHLNYRTIK